MEKTLKKFDPHMRTIDIIKEILGNEEVLNFCYGNLLFHIIQAKKGNSPSDNLRKAEKYLEYLKDEVKEDIQKDDHIYYE